MADRRYGVGWVAEGFSYGLPKWAKYPHCRLDDAEHRLEVAHEGKKYAVLLDGRQIMITTDRHRAVWTASQIIVDPYQFITAVPTWMS